VKTIEVVAAIIQNGDKILATQRGYGELKDGWEFPGGKMEPGESREEALVREIKEELQTDIQVEQYLTTVEYDYPQFHLKMHCFICKIIGDRITLIEHKAAKWLTRETLESVEWLPADVAVVRALAAML